MRGDAHAMLRWRMMGEVKRILVSGAAAGMADEATQARHECDEESAD